MSNLEKVCVITGASGGIGRTIVKKFYDNDYRVVMLDLNETAIQKVLEEGNYNDKVTYYVVDITNDEQVKETVSKIKNDLGRIDVLVNAAGIVGRYAKTTEYTLDNFKKIYSVNVFGTFSMMQYVLPVMMEQKGGAIVNFGSVSGMRGYTFEVGYGSSKWAVIGMTQTVANEYGEYGIRANSVSPGWVDTSMMANTLKNYQELGVMSPEDSITIGPLYNRPAKPTEIADAVYFLSNEEAHFITGANLVVDGGMIIG